MKILRDLSVRHRQVFHKRTTDPRAEQLLRGRSSPVLRWTTCWGLVSYQAGLVRERPLRGLADRVRRMNRSRPRAASLRQDQVSLSPALRLATCRNSLSYSPSLVEMARLRDLLLRMLQTHHTRTTCRMPLLCRINRQDLLFPMLRLTTCRGSLSYSPSLVEMARLRDLLLRMCRALHRRTTRRVSLSLLPGLVVRARLRGLLLRMRQTRHTRTTCRMPLLCRINCQDLLFPMLRLTTRRGSLSFLPSLVEMARLRGLLLRMRRALHTRTPDLVERLRLRDFLPLRMRRAHAPHRMNRSDERAASSLPGRLHQTPRRRLADRLRPNRRYLPRRGSMNRRPGTRANRKNPARTIRQRS
jgi:hypothetical protein